MKNLVIYSLIFGLISGLLAIIPVIGVMVFLIIIFSSSFIILVALKKTGNLVCPDEKTGLLYGGIAGFITFTGFAVVFLPVSYLLSFIFKDSYFTGIGMIVTNGFSLMITLVLFIGILCAMMNAFSGLASIYFFNSENSKAKFTLDINNKENK